MPTAPVTCLATSSPGWTTMWTCSGVHPNGPWRHVKSDCWTCSCPSRREGPSAVCPLLLCSLPNLLGVQVLGSPKPAPLTVLLSCSSSPSLTSHVLPFAIPKALQPSCCPVWPCPPCAVYPSVSQHARPHPQLTLSFPGTPELGSVWFLGDAGWGLAGFPIPATLTTGSTSEAQEPLRGLALPKPLLNGAKMSRHSSVLFTTLSQGRSLLASLHFSSLCLSISLSIPALPWS